MMTKKTITIIIFSLVISLVNAQTLNKSLQFYEPTHPYIQYTGRIDFTNPNLPRFWQPGVYITINFEGTDCEVILNDEVLWGKNQNYLEIIVDGKATRLQTKGKTDTIIVAQGLANTKHELIISKNTEASIGYLELAGIRCAHLLKPPPLPSRKIEFIGNSITCGASSDLSVIPCGKGVWQDQHNAWFSYGPVTARALNAQYYLSAVSGIGLIHSCCGMNILMPQVYDKVSMRDDTIQWNFKSYQPDLVTICLGQNDGVQDSASFCSNYISFIKKLRSYYPSAMIVCLSSPMADERLAAFMKKMIKAVVEDLHGKGEQKLSAYFFTKQYHRGCDSHPDLEEHGEIAGELIPFIRKTMGW